MWQRPSRTGESHECSCKGSLHFIWAKRLLTILGTGQTAYILPTLSLIVSGRSTWCDQLRLVTNHSGLVSKICLVSLFVLLIIDCVYRKRGVKKTHTHTPVLQNLVLIISLRSQYNHRKYSHES